MSNLVDNAVRHARRCVTISVAARDGEGHILVGNDGAPSPSRIGRTAPRSGSGCRPRCGPMELGVHRILRLLTVRWAEPSGTGPTVCRFNSGACGFFLPGDSLLFTTGLLIADGKYLHLPLWLACALITLAAVLGDQFGYAFGRRFGPAVFRRPNSRLFKQENLTPR